jgi:hypothetical protein
MQALTRFHLLTLDLRRNNAFKLRFPCAPIYRPLRSPLVTLAASGANVSRWRVPSVHEIRLKDRKGSTAAERTADAVAKANEDEAARAERDGYQTGRQTSG